MLYSHGYEHHYQIILRKNLNRYGWNPMSLPHHSVASSPPESRSQLHKRLWLGFTWQTLWSEITNEWKRDFSMVFLWFPTWPLEANFNINHQKPIQPAGTSKCSSRKFFTTPNRFWQTEAMLSAWRCRQISWAWKFGVYFQTNPWLAGFKMLGSPWIPNPKISISESCVKITDFILPNRDGQTKCKT